MSRKEYLEQLAYLLQDIPDNEREEALNYYTGYFEDAGEGEETNVIATLGSPEKVAAMIKYDLNSADYEAGEYSESGYQDDRFRENNKVPEVRGSYSRGNYGYQHNYEQKTQNIRPEKGSNLKIGWIVLLCILAVPIGIPILASIFAVLVSILAVAFAIVVSAAVMTIACIACGIALIIAGVVNLVITPANALLLGGVGMLMLAFGILMVLVCIIVAGKFIPWLIRGITNIFSRLLKRGGSAA